MITLAEAWAVTERARKMCERAEHDRPVPIPPCMPHAIEVAKEHRRRAA